MHDTQIEGQVDKIAAPLWVIAVCLIGILLCLLWGDAHAQSAIVSFDTAEQLVAITDSVIADCPCDRYVQANGEVIYSDYPRGRECDCSRELVCLTVVKESSITIVEQIERRYLGNVEHYKKVARGEAPPMSTEILIVGSPGTAIITWKEVKR